MNTIQLPIEIEDIIIDYRLQLNHAEKLNKSLCWINRLDVDSSWKWDGINTKFRFRVRPGLYYQIMKISVDDGEVSAYYYRNNIRNWDKKIIKWSNQD